MPFTPALPERVDFYRFVIAANGKIDNASASFTRRSCTETGRQVKRSCACANESVSGISSVVSCQASAIGGKPTREESRGAITAIHWSPSCRAKLTQDSANTQSGVSGRYSPCWKSSTCARRNCNTRCVRSILMRPSAQLRTRSWGLAVASDSSISRRRL